MKYLKTKKLFYGEYPYRVTCRINGASLLKRFNKDALTQAFTNDSLDWIFVRRSINKFDLKRFIKAVDPFLKLNIKTRAESNWFDIFCKDKDLLDNILIDLDRWIVTVTEPENQQEFELMHKINKGQILCTRLPYSNFNYKLSLSHTMPEDIKINFFNWTKNYPDSIKVTGSTYDWLNNTKKWIYTPYIYIKDPGTLMLVRLFLGSYCKTSYEYILKSSINTSCLH